MQAIELHEDRFLKIFWEEKAHIIGIDWKDSTSAMTGEEFKQELTLFAGYVEAKHAPGILVDVSKFCHRPDPEFMPWPVKNISNQYTAAGVKREAFLFPKGAQIPLDEPIGARGGVSYSRLRQSRRGHRLVDGAE